MRPFFVTSASVRHLKGLLARPGSSLATVPSSHLSEALAAGLGCRTYAALRARLAASPVAEVILPDTAACKRRLAELGHTHAAARWPGFPDMLARRGYPIPTYKGTRVRAWRNMMIAGINVALAQRLVGYGPEDNWWRDRADPAGQFDFDFLGDIPALGCLSDAGFGELRVSVLLYPKKDVRMTDTGSGFRDGSAFASGWLERNLGVWLQTGNRPMLECRQHLLKPVADAVITPKGFGDRGRFMM